MITKQVQKMSAKYAADTQCFKVEDGKQEEAWAVKELAVYNGISSYHYIFRPPFPFREMIKDLQREAKWVQNNLHSLPWNVGHENYEDKPFGLLYRLVKPFSG